MLILDEFLGLLDNRMISAEELEALLSSRSEDTEVILTGRVLDERFAEYADEIYKIQVEKH